MPRCCRALLLTAAALCGHKALGAPAPVTITNLSGAALDRLPVSFAPPAPTPRVATGSIPWQPDPDDPSRVWVLVTLPPHGSRDLALAAAAPPTPAPSATWDTQVSRGSLANDLIRVTVTGGETDLALADGRALLQSLSFYGWLTDAPITPQEAQAKGVPHVNTRNLPVAAGRVLAAGPVLSALELRRETTSEAAGLVLTERFTAFAGRAPVEYRLTLLNARASDLYIADCDGLLYARWPASQRPLRVYYPRGVDGVALSGEWLGLPAASPSSDRGLWAAATTRPGPSLGLAVLAGAFQTWAFTQDAFWLYLTDPAGRRPIRLAPGQSLTWRLLITATESGGDEAADTVQRACAQALRPPVRVTLDGQVLAEGAPGSLGPGVTTPTLLSPFDGQPLTDRAIFCTWQSVPGAARYELQLARTADFAAARSFRAPALDADKSAWMPHDLPERGLWHWRVRAITTDGEPGGWSAPRTFTLSSPAPTRPAAHAPSAGSPLFVLHAPSEIAQAWAAIPDDLRPHCALRLEVAERNLDLRALCRTAQACGANLIIQCSGPGGGPYSEIYQRHYGRQSLSELEWAFDHCPQVIGALVCEQNFHVRSDPASAEYVRRLAGLVAAHGKLLMFADGHWGSFAWLKMGEDPRLLDIFRSHPHHVVPLWKMNCGQVPLSIHGAVLGYWVAGIVDQFGVEPEDWYWFEAGFQDLGQATGRLNGGDHEKLPPTMWAQMLLTGLASGASCFCLEPYTGMWRYGHPDQPTDTWVRVIRPLLQAVVAHHLIPDRAAALRDVKLAVQTPPGLSFGPDYGALKPLYETLYGVRHFAELIPDSSRYGFIPLLPPLAADAPLPAGMRRITPADLTTTQAVHAAFDPLYPSRAQGDAFVRLIGDTLVAMNNRENEDVTERFVLAPGVPGWRELSAELGPHAYIVGKREQGGLWLQINGRPGRSAELGIRSDRQPTVVCTSPALTSAWDPAAKAVTLTVRHDAEAVELVVRRGAGG